MSDQERNPRDLGIYEEGPGRYRVVVSTGRRTAKGYGQVVRIVRGTKTDARRLRDQLRADLSREIFATPAKESLATYLETWLERIKPPHGSIKVSTWTSYAKHVRAHLLTDPIATRGVGSLGKVDADDLFRRLLDKGLSPATVQSIRRTLRVALNAHPTLTTNVATLAPGPRAPKPEMDKDKLWTHAHARRFLAHTAEQDRDMAALVRLGLDSGARLGELTGLAWPDVNLAHHTIWFRRSVSTARLPGDEAMLRFDTPKNGKPRKVDVDASTIAALVQMRERQSSEPVTDVGQLVFRRATTLGFQPWRPDVTTHQFQKLCTDATVPVTPFHYLRHACASWLLEAGMDVVAVSERLGHWSPALTLAVYAHSIPGRQRELARAIGSALE